MDARADAWTDVAASVRCSVTFSFSVSLLTMPFIEGAKYPTAAVVGWGMLAGGLFVCAVAFSFVSVQLVGLSIGQGIWSGSAVVVSFLWGVCVFGDQVEAGMAAGGLLLIVIGVLGIAMCADIAQWIALRSGAVVDDNEGFGEGSLMREGKSVARRTSDSEARMGRGGDMRHSLLAAAESDGTITPFHARTRPGGSGSMDLDGQIVHPAVQRMPPPPLLDDPLAAHQRLQAQQQQQQPLHYGSDGTPITVDMDWRGGAGRSSTSFDGSVAPLRSPSPTLEEEEEMRAEAAALAKQRQLYGSVCALVTGIFGGSILMPLQLAPSKYQGLSFVPSFGLGTLIVAPLITLPYMWLSRSSGSRGHWAVRQSLIPGLLAGTVWNGANVASIFAIKAVGYAVAYPLMQVGAGRSGAGCCGGEWAVGPLRWHVAHGSLFALRFVSLCVQCAIAVAALWGVLVFREIRGRQIGVMAASACVVLGGAVLLAVSKK